MYRFKDLIALFLGPVVSWSDVTTNLNAEVTPVPSFPCVPPLRSTSNMFLPIRKIDEDVLTRYSLSRSVAQWEIELSEDFDKEFVLMSLYEEFRIIPEGCLVGTADCKNYSGALNTRLKHVSVPVLKRKFLKEKHSLQASKSPRIQAIEAITKKGHDSFRP